MGIDILIVAEETENIRKYIPTIVKSFKYVTNDIQVEIANPLLMQTDHFQTTKGLLLLLCGSKDKAITQLQNWSRCLQRSCFYKEKALVITTLSEQFKSPRVTEEGTCSIVCCESLDRIEDWVPEFVQTFFPLWNNHDTRLGIYNRSPEYPLATETTDSLVKTFTRLGMQIYRGTTSENVRLKVEQSVKSCVFVLRSSLVHKQDVIEDVRSACKDICSNKHVYILSTQYTLITDKGSCPVYNGFCRLDIVEFIMIVLVGLRLVKPQNFLRKLLDLLERRCRPTPFLLLKFILSCIVFMINHVFGLLILLLFPIFLLVVYDVLMDILHVKRERRWDRIERLCCSNVTEKTVYSSGFSIFLYLFTIRIWMVAPVPILVIISVVPICVLLWHTFLHTLLFKTKLGFEFGAFSLPYIWWQ